MKNRKKLTAMILSGVLIFSQGSAAWAGEEMAGGMGSDMIVEKDAAPQMGAGIGMNVPAGRGEYEGIVGSAALGVGADFGELSGGAQSAEDADTAVLEDIELTLQIRGSYMLMDAEDEYFYYIYTWGEQGIPDIMVGAYNWDSTDGFFDIFTDYLRQSRTDLTVVQEPEAVVIGGKDLQKIVYNYTIQGYTIQDTRYIWLGPNSSVYMFTKREIPDIGYTLGTTLEDIISTAAVTGMETAPSVPETNAPQPETTAPQPETTAPQPETTAPSGQNSLYVQNADSSWTVTTDYYTMTIPPAWTGHFDAAIQTTAYGNGYSLKVVNKESADANFGGHLFTVMLIPVGENYSEFPSYDYLGTMEGPAGTYSVVILYPTDYQTGGVWEEFYKILYGDKNSAITSMKPVSGVTWTLPNGQVVSGSGTETAQTQVTQPETTAPQPETTAPVPQTTGSADVLGTTVGNSYSNGLFGLNFNAPSGWIMANADQLVELNQGLSSEQYLSTIESGNPVCLAYAQSMDGMEIMSVVAQNAGPFLDASITELTQEDTKTILEQCSSASSSTLESFGAVVTSAGVNSITCMGRTFYSLDISFTYMGFSGMQKQICVTSGTYLGMITVRSVSGDNTQATFDMFLAA